MEKKEKGKQIRTSVIIMFVVVIIALFLTLIQFLTNWVWFKEMGYVEVFFKQLVTQIEVGIPMFIVVSALVLIYLRRLKGGYFRKIASHEETNLKTLNKYTTLLALVFGAVATYITVSKLWFEILTYTNSTSFGKTDPLFNLDISFYIFKFDFLIQLNALVIGFVVTIVILTIIYYIILLTMHSPDILKEDGPEYVNNDERYSGSSNPFGGEGKAFSSASSLFDKIQEAFTGKKSEPTPESARKKHINDNNFKQLMGIASGQLSVLGVIFFIMLAINFFLKQFELLQAHRGAVYGAGFTDVNITLWMYRLLVVIALIGAITIVRHIRKKQLIKILTIPVIMIAVGLLGTGIAFLVQNFVVSPDEINKEYAYLENNIEYTQFAYNLDNVTKTSFAADNMLTSKDIVNNSDTISNIRINDYTPVQTFYNQTQSIRQYYTFNGVDIDRYNINGKYTQTYMATREIDYTKITDTWLNKHLKYTHGYGVTLSRVNKVTASGQPDVLIGDIPPVSTVKEIKITTPAVYFGELSNDYILVGTDETEFDYPDGNDNKYSKYDGTAGIKMTFFNKLMFSIRERSLKLLVSSNITSDSKIIINRNIITRIKTIMPYLTYDNDPYIVTINGRLYWIIDAYTSSSYYPYSQPYTGEVGGTNYVRNSVKVVVDAYNGDVNYYIVDKTDPIAATYAKIYPTLFKTYEQMPEGLKAHLRYPNTIFEIQANVYSRYHMNDVKVFYQNEDVWDIANEIYGTKQTEMTPNYYIVKLPGEKKAEFVNSIPYTPKSKQNMTALLVARNDGNNYGKIVLYQFPKSKTIYGPMQVEAQIDQSTEISKEFSLWNSSGSTYSRGNLFVIPIESSILYVEPVYLEASNSAIPEVKRVIVVYNDKIAYEATLEQALESLFGNDANNDKTKTNTGSDISQEDLISRAAEAYTNAQDAQTSGDWAAYGEYMKSLKIYLDKLAGSN